MRERYPGAPPDDPSPGGAARSEAHAHPTEHSTSGATIAGLAQRNLVGEAEVVIETGGIGVPTIEEILHAHGGHHTVPCVDRDETCLTGDVHPRVRCERHPLRRREVRRVIVVLARPDAQRPQLEAMTSGAEACADVERASRTAQQARPG